MTQSFTAPLQEGRGGGAFVKVPFAVEEIFGGKDPQVIAVIEGESIPTRLVRMGAAGYVLGVPRAIRTKARKNYSDSIAVTVTSDATPRVVVVPPDLQRALASHKSAKEFFDKLSYTHRKEYVRWIESAKRDETRAHRLAKTIEMLKAKQRGK